MSDTEKEKIVEKMIEKIEDPKVAETDNSIQNISIVTKFRWSILTGL